MTASGQPAIETIRAFYDDFSRQFLIDYVHGNPRIERAIQHVVNWIPSGAKAVLDIGCGIGWSTAEIARHAPNPSVTGLDLSETSIAIARRLFDEPGLTFASADVTESRWAPAGTFDAVTLIDVYEHIPAGARRALNRSLSAVLRDNAVIVLSFPSAAHQQSLADHHPEGLQPVDETITAEIVEELAHDVAGQVELFEPVTIWNPSDYVHAVVRRGRAESPSGGHRTAASLEEASRRSERAISKLGVRVSHDGYLIPQRDGPPVLVVSPVRNAYSETFIKAQIEGLPTRVEVLFGVPPEAEDDQGRPLRPKWARRVRFLIAKAFGARTAARWDAYLLDRFLVSRGIRAVLAEYGPTGTRLIDACRRRSIPLITYFYGFDATDRDVIEGLRVEYDRLLKGGSELIAVSHDLENRLYDLGATAGAIHCIPCGVDVDRFSGSDPAANPRVFLATGRFVEKKAPDLTLLAFSRVLARVPDAQLLMVGDGPLLGVCQRMAGALGLGGSVRFLGPLPHRQLADLLRGARAFVQHSVTAPSGESEGTPVAILEAGASGVPVVATRHGGIPDIVIDGETGFLVNEGDIDAMADRMIGLALDPGLAGRLGARARSHVTAEFRFSESLDRLWSVVDDAISRAGA